MDNRSPPRSSRRASSGYTGSISSPSPRSSFGTRSSTANNQALPAPPPSSRHRSESPLAPSTAVDPSTPRVGSRVKVSHKQETLFGTVLYVGETHFSTRIGTIWAGIRLDEPKGNHDGEFKNERYFTCEPKHGLFQHLGNIKVIDNFEAPPAHSSPTLHSGPPAPASSTFSMTRGAAALALSPSPRRPATASSSPRSAVLRPQVLSLSTNRSAPPPPFLTTTSTTMRRSTATPPAFNTHSSTSPSTNTSSNRTSSSIMSLATPSTTHNAPANSTTADSASTSASNNEDLLEGMILEQLTHSKEIREKLAAMMSEEVERKVNERLQQVREETTNLKDQLNVERNFMSTFVSGGIQRIEDKIAELKDSITASAAAATGDRQTQEQMEEQKLALVAIMEIASATKRQLQEEVQQRTEAIQQLRIMSEEEGNP